jgi:pilus assembly protein CpaE
MSRVMTATTMALVVMDDDVDRGLVETLLTSSPHLDVADFVDLSEQRSERGDGDVLVVACADFDSQVSEYLRVASRTHPSRPIVLICTAPTNGYIADAIEDGADDIVTVPVDSDPDTAHALSGDVVVSVEKALARKRGTQLQAAQQLGRMICVLGLKGGSGKTLTSSNLAVSLAGKGHSVAIVDLDLQFGDVGLALGLSPERTIYDLVRSGGSLDAEKLADFLTVHSSGVRALLAPARPDQAGVVTPEFLKEVYPLLRSMHDFVIVDTPPSFTPEVIATVDASSEACIVAMLDSLSLKNSKLGLETLELMDYGGGVRFVLNRADSNVGISPEDVATIMGRMPDLLIPSDRNITRAVNQGEPISLMHRRSDAARSFSALAGLYIADQERPKAKSGRLRQRRLFRRAGR